jgi:hypothetical protein
VIGKPLGIIGFSIMRSKRALPGSQRSELVQNVSGRNLGGNRIHSLNFVSSRVFDDPAHLMETKTAVLVATLIAGVAGYFGLKHEARQEDARQPKFPHCNSCAVYNFWCAGAHVATVHSTRHPGAKRAQFVRPRRNICVLE